MSTENAVSPKSNRIAEALFGKTRLKVLGLLFGNPGESFYIRQIAREANAGLGAVQRELENLWRAELIIRRAEARQVYFSANTHSPVFGELQSFVAKTGGLETKLKLELERLARRRLVDFAFIYGSIASGRQSASSDVDLMVIGQVTLRRLLPVLRRLQEELGREVNPSVYTLAEFTKKGALGDHFVRRVLHKRKFMLVGTEDELESLVRESMAVGP